MTRVGVCVVVAGVLLGSALWSRHDVRAEGFPTEFKNLQVFDKKTAPDELKRTMNGFTDQLGVKCTFCHNTDNYASDEKRHKNDARKMIQLVLYLKANREKYFNPRAKDELFACGTCHRGKNEPEPFVP
jgi:hypothetical protein